MRIENFRNGIQANSNTKVDKSSGGSFGDILKSMLDSANEAQIKADEETQKLISGESADIHNALIAAEEARIQLELVVQVRNKLLESYQEITKMQV